MTRLEHCKPRDDGMPEAMRGDVEIWQFDLDCADWDSLAGTLSAEESARAARYATETLRARSRRCRSALRALLGRRLGRAPRALAFQFNRWGKPALSPHGCHFNVSHSEGHALVALSDETIGVDIERVGRAGIDVADLAPMVFHPGELAEWKDTPHPLRERRFYETWTAKEAYCKARGEGLQIAMPSVRIVGNRVVHDDAPPVSWFIHVVEVLAEHSANLCMAQPHVRIKHRQAMVEDFL